MASKLERILNLLAALMSTGRALTAEEIWERVEGYPERVPDDPRALAAFRRAFERDKEELRGIGATIELERIETDEGPVDAYRVRKGQVLLDDPGLESDELAALHLATAAVRLDGLDIPEALWKLGGREGAAEDVPPDEVIVSTHPYLVPLFDAVAKRRLATFTYGGREREVEPYGLRFSRGRWYLSGYDRTRQGARRFVLGRIESAVDTGAPGAFERRDDLDFAEPEPWELGSEEPIDARLLIDAGQAAWARSYLGQDRIVEERADGATVFALSVRDRDAFRSFVVGFLEHAEVLEPPELREDIAIWIRDRRAAIADALAGGV